MLTEHHECPYIRYITTHNIHWQLKNHYQEEILNKNKLKNNLIYGKIFNSDHNSDYHKLQNVFPRGQTTIYYRIFIFTWKY